MEFSNFRVVKKQVVFLCIFRSFPVIKISFRKYQLYFNGKFHFKIFFKTFPTCNYIINSLYPLLCRFLLKQINTCALFTVWLLLPHLETLKARNKEAELICSLITFEWLHQLISENCVRKCWSSLVSMMVEVLCYAWKAECWFCQFVK